MPRYLNVIDISPRPGWNVVKAILVKNTFTKLHPEKVDIESYWLFPGMALWQCMHDTFVCTANYQYYIPVRKTIGPHCGHWEKAMVRTANKRWKPLVRTYWRGFELGIIVIFSHWSAAQTNMGINSLQHTIVVRSSKRSKNRFWLLLINDVKCYDNVLYTKFKMRKNAVNTAPRQHV